MASLIKASIPTFSGFCICDASSRSSSTSSLPSYFPNFSARNPNSRTLRRNFNGGRFCRAMVQEATFQGAGPSATYAREMERLSAKESLLIALKDAGGFKAVVSGKTTEMQRIDVMERITVLERLNPTPRPTTSPYLEGRWNFEWLVTGSPAAQFILERFPTSLANVSKMDLFLKDNYAKVTASLRLLNSVESKFTVSSKLSVEGPLRMKEEIAEGLLESPTVIDEAVPDQLRNALGQAAGAVQQLPVPIRDVMSSGIRLPLSGSFQRLFMVSYLDEEIFIIRDAFGAPEVLTRLDVGLPEEKDNDSIEKLVSISIPLTLKKQSMNDFEFINHMDQLVKLPRIPNVDEIIEKHHDYRRKESVVPESVGEVLSGIGKRQLTRSRSLLAYPFPLH